jgi:hypothetical protein
MIGVIILLVYSRVCGVTKIIKLNLAREVLPQKDIHYPESTTFSFGLISLFYF